MFYFYVFGLLATSSLLLAWFRSGMGVHFFQVLYALGWRRDVPGFWPGAADVQGWLRHEWEEWLILRFQKPDWFSLGELLTCPVCLSFQASLLVSLVLLLPCCLLNGTCGLLLPVLAFFTWPCLIALVFKNT